MSDAALAEPDRYEPDEPAEPSAVLTEKSGLDRALVTVSIMLATIMQAVDTTIANVALPHMQGAVSATQDQISWVLTSYIVAAAIMTPPTAIISARLGRRRYFIIAIIGFVVASMWCGISTSLGEIVAARLLQGVFGAGLVPLSQAVVLDMYPREKQGEAMAWWGVGVMVGPILGPSLGGYLTDMYSWRWVFFINLPVGVLALMGILAFLPETERNRKRRFDLPGFALLSLAIGALQLMLDRGQTQDWFQSREIVVEAVTAIICFYLFVVHMFSARQPFIEPRLFRDRNLTAGLTLIFLVGVILLATMALLPPFLQNLQGYPVVTTGLVMAPRGAGTMAAMLVVGRLITRMDPRKLILLGLGLTALSLWEMSGFNLQIGPWDVVRTGIVQGLGLGFIFVPMSTLTFATLPTDLRTEGTAMFSLTRNIGSSIGISVVITLLAQHTQAHHAALVEFVNPFRDWMRAVPAWNWTHPAGAVALNNEITRQAAAIAYLDDFRFMMWCTIVAAPMLLLMRRPRYE